MIAFQLGCNLKVDGDKMKKIFLMILFIGITIQAQKVSVIEDKPITSLKEGSFFYPIVTPDGNNLLFSREDRKGLWIKNLSTGKTQKISNATASGFEPVFTSDGSSILFRENKIVNGKIYSSLKSFDLISKTISLKEENIRDLKILKNANNLSQSYLTNNETKQLAGKSLQKKNAEEISVTVDLNKIVLYKNGEKKYLAPMGDVYYLWPSISPDKTKLLFTAAGKGTYISDLQGTIIKKIGYANYPSWSPDGNWVLFMKDIDNGEVVISSEIYLANINTGKYFNLTEQQKEIALYPTWGSTLEEIFYNTDRGQIRKLKLKYE